MAKTPKNKGKYPPNDGLWWVITILCFCTGVLWWLGLLLIYLNVNGRLPPLNAERRRSIEGSLRKGLSGAQEQIHQMTNQQKAAVEQPTAPPAAPTELAHPKQKRSAGKAMALIGGICSGALAIAFFTLGLRWLSWGNMEDLVALGSVGILLIVSLTVAGFGVKRMGIGRRFAHYHPVLLRGSRAVGELAKTLGISKRRVRKELQEMIDQGWLGEGAYLDRGQDLLVCGQLLGAAYAAPAPQAPPAGSRPSRMPNKEDLLRKDRGSVTQPGGAAASQSVLSKEEEILRKIRRNSLRIQNEQMSAQIERIELLTKKIFRCVDERPEKEKELRSFMSYYLPQTLKILDTYARMEEQGVDGENIVTAKRQIEELMDKLVESYEKQLDRLFAGDVLDITTDIAVMKAMLARDGLAEDLLEPELPEL
ncbi:MAG: 5-bromo-4-chloroindolyl phosphate hydrolysis family protein [Clostridiales bacterium]|nr:5-bromo-4-chloroindolyl phosphate hydrolysis family protein [Clostridiales bacterium]